MVASQHSCLRLGGREGQTRKRDFGFRAKGFMVRASAIESPPASRNIVAHFTARNASLSKFDARNDYLELFDVFLLKLGLFSHHLITTARSSHSNAVKSR